MLDTTPGTVTAALDVHKNSVRLAAVRRDELLAEQTLALRPRGCLPRALPLARGPLLL